MDPTIVAAIISALAVAITALIGNRYTARGIRGTQENTERLIAAERERQLWDRRASAYVDLLGFMHHQGAGWHNALRTVRFNSELEEVQQAWLASYTPASSFEREARLTAYGSTALLDSFREWQQRETHLASAASGWRELADMTRQTFGESGPVLRAYDEMNQALASLDEGLQAIARLVAGELQQHTTGPNPPRLGWRGRLPRLERDGED